MKLSSSQKKAINPRISCWVEASAGTGKTKVLIDRILNLLLAGADVSDILCLTFTKAAGVEMTNRLKSRLHHWAVVDQETLRSELEDFLGPSFSEVFLERARQLFSLVLDSLRGVNIQTIHGFCQSLLRTFPLEAGLLPHFKIMDSVEKKNLFEESYIKLWRDLEEDEIRKIVEHFSETQFHQFLEFSLEHKLILSQGPMEQFVKNLEIALDLNRNQTTEYNRVSLENTKEAILSHEGVSASDEKLYGSFLEFKNFLPKEKQEKFHEYKALFLTREGSIRKRIFSKSFGEKFPEVSSLLEQEAESVFFLQQFQLKEKIIERSKLLMRVSGQFIKIYEQIKSQNVWLDYDDLIIRTRDLLKRSHMKPWVLEKLDYKINHVLVDEAQDTSDIQWDLILALIEEFYMGNRDNDRTFFVVGDLKQSIYSFQGASPQAFDRAKKAFQKLPRCLTIPLSTSYRSTPIVLRFVDEVFKELESNSYTTHECSREGDSGIVEVWPLVEQKKKEEESKGWMVDDHPCFEENTSLLLAKKIASTISEWLEKGEWLEAQNRLLEPRDIMILVRRRNVFMEEMVRSLKEKNIPVTGLDRMILTDQLVVQDLLCLCDVLLLMEDDLSLATLLKSPLFNLSEDQIALLCIHRKDRSLWEYLKEDISFEKIVSELLYLKDLAEIKSPHAFFTFVLSVWGGKNRFLERLGPEIEDVLEEFLMVCRTYELTYGISLQRFVCWIRQQNIEIKRSLEQTEENKVRIMTVHGAKGLQAPVVFLPDTTQIPVDSSSFYWQETPPFLMWADRESRKVVEVQNLINKDPQFLEYYRLLYVALTRAEDRLYVCGWEPQKGVDPQSWYALLNSAMARMVEREQKECIPLIKTYGSVDRSASKEQENKSFVQDDRVPDWLVKPWDSERLSHLNSSDRITTANPSSSSAEKDRGVIIHKILQFSLYAQESQRMELIDRYINTLPFSDTIKNQIRKAVENVFFHPDFFVFFTKKTRTEVSIQGYWKDRVVRGVIDVLTISEENKRISILDYKTGAFLERYRENPPLEYTKQMAFYKKMIQDIYPEYKVVCGLLWTEVGWIQHL